MCWSFSDAPNSYIHLVTTNPYNKTPQVQVFFTNFDLEMYGNNIQYFYSGQRKAIPLWK